jgi:hypothetical protein
VFVQGIKNFNVVPKASTCLLYNDLFKLIVSPRVF